MAATAESRSVLLEAGPLTLTLEDGALCGLAYEGVEVLRRIDYPIRDADWRTLAVQESDADVGDARGLRVSRTFRTRDGAFEGRFTAHARADAAGGVRLDAELALTARAAVRVNRAGFILLHPIAGVAGSRLDVRRPDGSSETVSFPRRISPSQPVFDIAGLTHEVDGVRVAISLSGETFEMEDQRNWTDASFKTYCRPLALPRPFAVAAGETIRQQVRVDLVRVAPPRGAGPPAAARGAATAPAIALAHEAALAGGASIPAAVAGLGAAKVLLRVDARDPGEAPAPPPGAELTLEIVLDPDDVAGGLGRVAGLGLAPRRVVALPRGYLASHQPEGPWPAGPTPGTVIAATRAAFPGAEVGGGMLTNFTEFNRHPPDPAAIDFATFGTTAIVHAADDRSVLETLEALGDVFASARALAGDRPLRLGLISIGMRSNPYGDAVAANPDHRRVAMALDDPRQRERFAAAWAVAAAVAAARGGVASFAPAMTAGPLGMGADGALWPLYAATAALAALGGAAVDAAGGPRAGLVGLHGRGRRGVAGVVANLGPGPARLETDAAVLHLSERTRTDASRDAGWIDRPGAQVSGGVTLAPFDVAILKATA